MHMPSSPAEDREVPRERVEPADGRATDDVRSQVTLGDEGFCVDASLVGSLLHVPASDVPLLMRDHKITGICERGEGALEGRFRLTFFHGARRARLELDHRGRILTRSVLDFGKETTAANSGDRG
jgi:hypothetical protein